MILDVATSATSRSVVSSVSLWDDTGPTLLGPVAAYASNLRCSLPLFSFRACLYACQPESFASRGPYDNVVPACRSRAREVGP